MQYLLCQFIIIAIVFRMFVYISLISRKVEYLLICSFGNFDFLYHELLFFFFFLLGSLSFYL